MNKALATFVVLAIVVVVFFVGIQFMYGGQSENAISLTNNIGFAGVNDMMDH